MWYAYVLKSKKNGRLYIGSTDNIKRRIKEHNSGSCGKYTKSNFPYELILCEIYLNKKDANSAELFYKSGYGREVLKGKLSNYLKDYSQSSEIV